MITIQHKLSILKHTPTQPGKGQETIYVMDNFSIVEDKSLQGLKIIR